MIMHWELWILHHHHWTDHFPSLSLFLSLTHKAFIYLPVQNEKQQQNNTVQWTARLSQTAPTIINKNQRMFNESTNGDRKSEAKLNIFNKTKCRTSSRVSESVSQWISFLPNMLPHDTYTHANNRTDKPTNKAFPERSDLCLQCQSYFPRAEGRKTNWQIIK